MRKIVCFISIVVLIFCFSVTGFADGNDIFYYDYTDKILQDSLELEISKESRKIADTWYIENYYSYHFLENGEKADLDKVSYDITKLYAKYDWSFEKIVEFMKADDKKAYLKTLQPKMLFYPVFYDGERIEDYYARLRYNDTGKYAGYFTADSAGIPLSSYTLDSGVIYPDKQEIIELLEKDEILGYEIIHSIFLEPFSFVIAQKDGQTYAIYMPTDASAQNDKYKAHKQMFDTRVLSVDQMESLSEFHKTDSLSEMPEDSVGASANMDNDLSRVPDLWIYVVIPVVLAVVLAAVCILIILKKKKS
ncbi:MAG: hypothetical protein IJ408_06555 [Clostridia bacterium]|nr:hypothetical protein [Clostridia bacterium]